MKGVSTTNPSSHSQAIAPRNWNGCGSISSGQIPLITRPAGASSSKGILRRKGAKRRLRQRPRLAPGFSRRRPPWLAWVSYLFSDRGPRPQIDPDRLGIAMPQRTAANGTETRDDLFPLRVVCHEGAVASIGGAQLYER